MTDDLTPAERIVRMASEPLESTGQPPSPEAVEEALRIAQAVEPPVAPQPDEAEEETPPEPASWAAAAGRLPLYEGALPPDIEQVWGNGRLDGSGQPAEITARTLIQGWGMETFRGSAIHQQAVQEFERDKRMNAIRAAFIKAKGSKT